MYLFIWVLLVSVSLLISILAFLWAIRSGQFTDQARAGRLPLEHDDPPPPVESHPSRRPVESYAMMGIIVLGAAVMMAAIIVSLYNKG